MPPMTTTAKTTIIRLLSHQRLHLHHRRGEYAGKGSQRDAKAVGQGDHQRHVDTEGFGQFGVFGTGAQQRPELGAFDHEPGPKQTISDARTTQAR